jgi:4-azaleucine resistance transporter AzlC
MQFDSRMKRDVMRGLSRVWAMALGYIVIGFSVAATAFAVGMNPANVLSMQMFVYAGTSQLIATKLLAGGAGLFAVAATTFIVNLRHLLMSSSLAPHLQHLTKWQLAAFTFSLSDEAFALHSTRFGTGHSQSRIELFTVNITLHIAWMIGAIAAVSMKMDEAILRQLGLDYAPAAMFIALLALLSRDTVQRVIMVVCGVLSVILVRLGVGPESVLISTIVGASIGTWIESWTSKKSSSQSLV